MVCSTRLAVIRTVNALCNHARKHPPSCQTTPHFRFERRLGLLVRPAASAVRGLTTPEAEESDDWNIRDHRQRARDDDERMMRKVIHRCRFQVAERDSRHARQEIREERQSAAPTAR
jgi:hypothetical protein